VLLSCQRLSAGKAKVYGDLDSDTARYLARVARERLRRIKAGEKGKPKAPPPVPPVPSPAGVKPGALIGREYQGVMHRVVVVQGGYEWRGQTYKSLSEIARLITGTRWNGPKFFGLRPPVSLKLCERVRTNLGTHRPRSCSIVRQQNGREQHAADAPKQCQGG
jgi:hypothetical protein